MKLLGHTVHLRRRFLQNGTLSMGSEQGKYLWGIDNKTVRRFQFVYICSLLSNTQFIRKQNGLKLQSNILLNSLFMISHIAQSFLL